MQFVLTEGCDCIGPGDGIGVDTIDPDPIVCRNYGGARTTVTILRNDDLFRHPRGPNPFDVSVEHAAKVTQLVEQIKHQKEKSDGHR